MPKLPRPTLPRVRLPRPPEAVIEAGRLPVELGRNGWDWWLSLSIYTRRRVSAAAGLLAVVGLIWLVATQALPCGVPGGESCPPSDQAIRLVPDDALAYAHVSLDRDSDQFAAAQEVVSRVPTLAQQVIGRVESRLPGAPGAPLDFDQEVAPWFDGERALAILPAGGRAAEAVELFGVGDQAGAHRYADSIATGRPRSVDDQGTELQVDGRGLATAIVGGFLAVGTRNGVGAVIDAYRGKDGAGSLAADSTADAARDALPGERLADAYLSRRGIARLVADPGSALEPFAPLIGPGASEGVAAALVAIDDGLGVDVRSILDPGRAPAHARLLSDLPSFEPSLPASLPADSLGYLGIGDPGETIGSLLTRARASEPGLAAAVGELTNSLGGLGDLDLERELGPVLGDEGALALEPSGHGGSGAPVPVLVGSGIDESRAAEALARLQRPGTLGSGADPDGRTRRIGDVTAHSIRISPTVELTYAVVGEALVIATDPAGVRAVIEASSGLAGSDGFRTATAGLPRDVSMLGYLNLGDLIALAERAGLARNPAYATFAPEIRRLEALGFAIQGTTHQLATDLRLVVAEDAAVAGTTPQRGPSD